MRDVRFGLVAVALLAGCPAEEPEPGDLEVTLGFDAFVRAAPAACGTDYAFGTPEMTGQLADARLFVSAVQLRNDAGTWVDVALDAASDWQHEGVALLDFEDGTAACADSGTAETNRVVTGVVPEGAYDAVRFDVGVPFALNHVDSATAPAPLNAPGMFWVWQGGYKFVRVDFTTPGGAIPRWNVHVGSTDCVSAAPTEPPATECGRPNRSTIEIDGFDPATDTVAIDLAALVDAADVSTNVEMSPPGCMSSPSEGADCAPVFGALGLGFETGTCDGDCAGQTVFSR
ncbi:MAG: metallo-mystery pair system four-Cys motif protein [Alphaproteobacteria bacterium]|nr:metallo-mystery pair system four-Cys motif protein [Alphaproteobacteria bacterium]